jgi:L-ribulose-5-phosphate 3-epimerase
MWRIDRILKAQLITNRIGVMQGRLLPKYQGRYQAHPVGCWLDEFPVAASLGVGLIEFIIDQEKILANPLMSEEGIIQLRAVIEETDVAVASVCADCFMAAPLHSRDKMVVDQSIANLRHLILNAAKLGIRDIVIPCVDQSSLKSADDTARFVAALESVTGLAETSRVNLSLETDLNPEMFWRLLERFDSPSITVNYDIGNSASLGYKPREELSAYGTRITDVHIKDRKKGGGSVILGTGDADFDAFFDALSFLDYTGPFIMQAYRDDEGVVAFRKQFEWIRPRLMDYFNRKET